MPVSKATRRSAIADVEIAVGAEFPDRHVNVLAERYREVAVPGLLHEVTARVAGAADSRLVDLTVPLVAWLADRFAITTPLVLASELPGEGRRSGLLASLAEAVGADRYVSPPGSLDYLAEDHTAFEERSIEVLVHRYDHPHYDQGSGPFQSHCSALDLALRHPERRPPSCRPGVVPLCRWPTHWRWFGEGHRRRCRPPGPGLGRPPRSPALPAGVPLRVGRALVARRLGRPAEDPSASPKRVLDMGCGAGRHLALLADAGHDVVGSDYSRAGLVHPRGHQGGRTGAAGAGSHAGAAVP